MKNHDIITMVLVGLGNRGRGVFGRHTLDMPHRAKCVAVVEYDSTKRNVFTDEHGIPESMRSRWSSKTAPEHQTEAILWLEWEFC